MSELKPGERVPLAGGGNAEVLYEIGSGGQGYVYKVKHNEKDYALKWYKASSLHNPEALRQNLEANIVKGAPSKRFLWPIKLTRSRKGEFGYLMPLRPEGYVDLASILNVETTFAGLHPLISSALNIVDSFRSLHRQGKCYQDLNDGSFFINPENGEVLICDNDNVAPDKTNLGMAGMPGYMAPEIVRGKAIPEIQTDYHSLAVVLFKLLVRHDPFMGKSFVDNVCITEDIEKKLYGDKPVFIFDPDNRSNAPVQSVHPNPLILWPIYPDYVRQGFVTTFVDGIKIPGKRLTDNEWRDILIRLRGEILTCQCGNEMFATAIESEKYNSAFTCPACGETHSFPMKLVMSDDSHVYLFPGSKLYACQTEIQNDDYERMTARVVRNKNNLSIWALKNMSESVWHACDGESTRAVAPGSVTIIAPGLHLDFGQVSGRIAD